MSQNGLAILVLFFIAGLILVLFLGPVMDAEVAQTSQHQPMFSMTGYGWYLILLAILGFIAVILLAAAKRG
ncbi:hypothetical protein GACE_0981 [Geoglobus acetivorans]|uniref:Uncharacterized protein n=2 Tax=Geoglobus acetivorans TaxID=565033 RepID=A0A0A7GGG0_GEOAI|nr:hypothetical protein GACE_0981 [Geoglobus acetivorans]